MSGKEVEGEGKKKEGGGGRDKGEEKQRKIDEGRICEGALLHDFSTKS